MQDYKSLCAAVRSRAATLVNIESDTHSAKRHFKQLIAIAQLDELKNLVIKSLCNLAGMCANVLAEVTNFW